MEAALDDVGYWQSLAAEQEAGTRDDCIPHFYMRAVESRSRSETAGRPVFDEVAYVRVLVPGDRNNVIDRRATEADRARWPRQWAGFLAKRAPRSGTPVEQWPYLTVARVAELKAAELFTVEQLADAETTELARLGEDGPELQRRARQFLAPQSETETALRAANAAQLRRLDEMASRLAALEDENARLREAAEAAPPRRTRR